MLDLSASIVLYNSPKQKLLEAIQSFLNTSLHVVLYLVDNSPTNQLESIIKDPRVQYIHNPSNPGFGAAHNIALNIVRATDSKYHLVLNPDVYFDAGVLESLVNYMDNNQEVANVMPLVLYPDGEIQYLCKLLPTPYDWIGRRFNPIKSMVEKRNNLFELKFTNYNQIMEVPYLSGCFMFLRMSALYKSGLFDEKIFMYGEETDLNRRLIDAGFKTIFYPKVNIYHHFEKGSHKSWHLTKIGIQSSIYYFNKWGWFFDSKRKKINNNTLQKLNRP